MDGEPSDSEASSRIELPFELGPFGLFCVVACFGGLIGAGVSLGLGQVGVESLAKGAAAGAILAGTLSASVHFHRRFGPLAKVVFLASGLITVFVTLWFNRTFTGQRVLDLLERYVGDENLARMVMLAIALGVVHMVLTAVLGIALAAAASLAAMRSVKEEFGLHSDQHGARLDSDARGTLWSLLWRDVDEIAAWKVDCYIHDLVCLGFRVRGEVDYYVCDEQTEGWDDLRRDMEAVFKIDPAKWEQVVKPPMETNLTVLWDRKWQ